MTPAAATQLVITQQPPATVKVSSRLRPESLDRGRVRQRGDDRLRHVSVAFANNPTGATLGGTLSVTASQGVASFTNLTINKTGSGYTLQVSSSGLTSATSNPINVTKNGKTASTLLASGREPGHGSLAGAAGARQPGSLGRPGFKKRHGRSDEARATPARKEVGHSSLTEHRNRVRLECPTYIRPMHSVDLTSSLTAGDSKESKPQPGAPVRNDRLTPDSLEAAADDAGVMDGVSGVAVAQVILDQPEIITPICEGEAAGVPQHMRVNLRQAGASPRSRSGN